MIEKARDLIELARGAVFGWRKLGVLIGILAAQFAWLFLFTVRGENSTHVPDLPIVFAATTVILYLTFVIGNWQEHKAKGGSGPS